MSSNAEELIHMYKRTLNENRFLFAVLGLSVAVITLIIAITWPKTYTASSTIYADNTNVLRPLLAGDAVTPDNGEDQSRMAQDILFSREYTDAVLTAAGWSIDTLSDLEKDRLIEAVKARTTIDNVGRGAANLVMISHSDSDPIIAFSVAQKYTTIFIEQAAISEQEESRQAFGFIESQVSSYQQKLQESEARLSAFKSENNYGTIANANNRIAGYRSEIERLDLDLVQIDTQMETVELQLAGELTVSRDLGEINSIRARINSLQMTLDSLRARFHDTYPDVVQVKNQISDLQEMLDSGETSGLPMLDAVDSEGFTPLHQELRRFLANLQTTKQSKFSERESLMKLLSAEEERARRINETEAELAELTRDYNVTQTFYNSMLGRLENARVSMNLNDEEQGITFKIQDAAVIPTQPDGFSFSQLMIASFVLAVGTPIGLMVVMLELDPRIRSESSWSKEWPPLMGVIPVMSTQPAWWRSVYVYITILLVIAMLLYGFAAYLQLSGLIE